VSERRGPPGVRSVCRYAKLRALVLCFSLPLSRPDLQRVATDSGGSKPRDSIPHHAKALAFFRKAEVASVSAIDEGGGPPTRSPCSGPMREAEHARSPRERGEDGGQVV